MYVSKFKCVESSVVKLAKSPIALLCISASYHHNVQE